MQLASFGILAGTLDYKIASATVLGANIGSDVIQQTLVLGIVIFAMGSLKFTKDFPQKKLLTDDWNNAALFITWA